MERQAFQALLERMTQAACRGDGEAVAACFTPKGVYHDGFYGPFEGAQAIARMIGEHFHGHARDLQWTLSDVVCDGSLGYARYDFSYVSKFPESAGKRVGFSGVSMCRLEGERITRYEELFERAQVLARLEFADARILKSVKRWAAERT